MNNVIWPNLYWQDIIDSRSVTMGIVGRRDCPLIMRWMDASRPLNSMKLIFKCSIESPESSLPNLILLIGRDSITLSNVLKPEFQISR